MPRAKRLLRDVPSPPHAMDLPGGWTMPLPLLLASPEHCASRFYGRMREARRDMPPWDALPGSQRAVILESCRKLQFDIQMALARHPPRRRRR